MPGWSFDNTFSCSFIVSSSLAAWSIFAAILEWVAWIFCKAQSHDLMSPAVQLQISLFTALTERNLQLMGILEVSKILFAFSSVRDLLQKTLLYPAKEEDTSWPNSWFSLYSATWFDQYIWSSSSCLSSAADAIVELLLRWVWVQLLLRLVWVLPPRDFTVGVVVEGLLFVLRSRCPWWVLVAVDDDSMDRDLDLFKVIGLFFDGVFVAIKLIAPSSDSPSFSTTKSTLLSTLTWPTGTSITAYWLMLVNW